MANTRVILRSNIHLNKGPEFARLIMGQNTIYSKKKKKRKIKKVIGNFHRSGANNVIITVSKFIWYERIRSLYLRMFFFPIFSVMELFSNQTCLVTLLFFVSKYLMYQELTNSLCLLVSLCEYGFLTSFQNNIKKDIYLMMYPWKTP